MTPLEAHYRRALEMLAEPLTVLHAAATGMGATLDTSIAQQLINEPRYYRTIARNALAHGEALARLEKE